MSREPQPNTTLTAAREDRRNRAGADASDDGWFDASSLPAAPSSLGAASLSPGTLTSDSASELASSTAGHIAAAAEWALSDAPPTSAPPLTVQFFSQASPSSSLTAASPCRSDEAAASSGGL